MAGNEAGSPTREKTMTDTTKAKRRPDFTAYFVPDRENANWVPIGAAWAHRDGEGFSLKLDLLPNTAGRFVLRSAKTEAAKETSGQPGGEGAP